MNRTSGYNNYLRQEVEGSSQVQLIVLMYEAAIRFMRNAVTAINHSMIEEAHNNIIKAEDIIYELITTLNTDAGGEVADNLLRLYDFMIWQLIDANAGKNAEKIESVIKLMVPIRDAWKEITQREQSAKQEPVGEVKPINISG